MAVSGQLRAFAALPPGKLPPVPTGYETEWAREPVWTLWRRENTSYTAGNGTRAVQHVTIPTASVVPFVRETLVVTLKGAQTGGLADGHRKLLS